MKLPNYTSLLPHPAACPCCGERALFLTSRHSQEEFGRVPKLVYQLSCSWCTTRTHWYETARSAYTSWNARETLLINATRRDPKEVPCSQIPLP